MAAVTVLGLGAMGSRMASGLMTAGHHVTVWNRNPERASSLAAQGALVASTPALAVAEAEFVIAMLRDDEASTAVWLDPTHGALAAMPQAATAIECSTLTVTCLRALAAEAAERGRRLIDAPLAGSRPQAENRQLIFFAGGDSATVAAVTPLLLALGQVHHVGSTGTGAALKLAVNALFGTQIAQLAELLALLAAAGVDPRRAVDIIGQTPVCSPALRTAATGMLSGLDSGEFTPMFPLHLVDKDFGYVAATAHALGRPVPISETARQVFQATVAAGHGEHNITAVIRRYLAAADAP